MADAIEWIIVRSWGDKEIGAVGFIGDQAVVIASFYEPADGNQDGKVSWGEWIAYKISPFNLNKIGIVQVAMQARVDDTIVLRDQSFDQSAKQLYINFATGLIKDGAYVAYLSMSVSKIATAIAGRVATGFIAQFMIRKGFEGAIKEVYRRSIGS